MGETILQAMQLGKSYGKHEALQDISFSLQRGEILGIAGENGAGKSTLLSLLATIQKPSHGTFYFQGTDIKSCKKAYRSGMGYVPQEIALFEELSGYDNLKFFGKACHVQGKQLKQQIDRVCEITEFPKEALKRPVSKYSGGMKRKINIAAALLHEPQLVLLDEPMANLDLETEEQIMSVLRKLSEEGRTIVYVGHQMEQMEQLCHSICLIKNGRQMLYGSLEEVLYRDGERISLRQLWKDVAGKSGNKE